MDTNKKQAIDALEEKRGIVTDACSSIGLARSTFYLWCKDDSEFKAAVDDIQEVALDYVESKLFEKISGVQVKKGEDDDGEDIVYDLPPSDTAIIFYLKTKGKKRGYIEKSELGFTDNEGNDVTPVQIFELPNNRRDEKTTDTPKP